jgi:hypothetical protein
MLTVRTRLFAALRAIQSALMIPPDAGLADHQRAIAEAYGLAEEASGLENVFDSDVDCEHELAWRELPD